MCTRNELDMILRKIAEVYRSVYGDELVSIFLYGSYAKGDYQSDSDIDVAAIVRGDRRSLQDKLKKVWDVARERLHSAEILLQEGFYWQDAQKAMQRSTWRQ